MTEISKNSGKLFLIAFLLTISTAAFAVSVQTEIGNPLIRVGESTILKITISNGGDIQPHYNPHIKGLKIDYAGSGRSIQIINFQRFESVVLNFNIEGRKRGTYRIPPFVFTANGKKVKSQSVSLKVTKGSSGANRSGGPQDIETLVSLSKKKIYLGEPVIMSYYTKSAGVNLTLEGFEKMPDVKGFAMQDMPFEPDDVIVNKAGIDHIKSKLQAFVLIPTRPGSFRVGGGSAIASSDISGGTDFFGNQVSRKLRLFFDAESLTVTELPNKNVPVDFSGDVGVFSIKAESEKRNVKVYEEKKITVTISGRGNFITLTKPVLSKKIQNAKVISQDGKSDLQIKGNTLIGEKSFIYTVIPKRAGKIELGNFKFSFFNTNTKHYETIETDSFTFNVSGDETAGRVEFDEERRDEINVNPVIILIVVLVVSIIIGLFVFWERRRYKLVTEDETDDEQDDTPEQKEKDDSDYINNLKEALNNEDSASFLSEADKFLTVLLKRSDFADNEKNKINEVKEKVYHLRYGGGSVTKNDLDNFFEKIKMLMK